MEQEFMIPVVWSMRGLVWQKASSLDEAIRLAAKAPLPKNGEYIDDSFMVDLEGDVNAIRALYNEN